MPGVFPDYKAPIVRTGAEGRELATARWGMPSSQHALMESTKKRAAKLESKGKPVDFKELLRMEPTPGRPTTATPPQSTGSAGRSAKACASCPSRASENEALPSGRQCGSRAT